VKTYSLKLKDIERIHDIATAKETSDSAVVREAINLLYTQTFPTPAPAPQALGISLGGGTWKTRLVKIAVETMQSTTLKPISVP
jgi:hypothetical protein